MRSQPLRSPPQEVIAAPTNGYSANGTGGGGSTSSTGGSTSSTGGSISTSPVVHRGEFEIRPGFVLSRSGYAFFWTDEGRFMRKRSLIRFRVSNNGIPERSDQRLIFSELVSQETASDHLKGVARGLVSQTREQKLADKEGDPFLVMKQDHVDESGAYGTQGKPIAHYSLTLSKQIKTVIRDLTLHVFLFPLPGMGSEETAKRIQDFYASMDAREAAFLEDLNELMHRFSETVNQLNELEGRPYEKLTPTIDPREVSPISVWRVAIFGEQDRNRWYAAWEAFGRKHPGVEAIRFYRSPFFKIQVGNFAKEKDAEAFRKKIQAAGEEYGSGGLFVVPGHQATSEEPHIR